MFSGRKLIIATKHHKEKVIAPILEKELGVHCFVDENFDTDQFGTFTGEIERVLDPLSSARTKCLHAMELNDCNLGIASEGSFGPHPSLFYMNADDEFLVFIDKKNDLEIIWRECSTETNFAAKTIKNFRELSQFCAEVYFPTHAVVLRKSQEESVDVFKGINSQETLKNTFDFLLNKYGEVFVETDMRALFNPTRMKIIETATKNLALKINTVCPHCKSPGFGVTEVKKGLKCELCGFPTKGILSHISECKKCHYRDEQFYPNHKTREDAMFCDFCNP